MRVRRSRRRGFTLVEMMVVIAIVGVLGAVASIQLRGQQTRGRFRASVRDLTGLIREARGNARLLGSGLGAPGSVANTNCPVEIFSAAIPAVVTPGLVVDTSNQRVTLIDNVSVVTVNPGAAGSCSGGLCLGTGAVCAVDGDCSGYPRYTIRCRTEDFRSVYNNEMFFVPEGAPSLLTTGTRPFVGFNSRGLLTTRTGAGAAVGRITIRENKGDSPMQQAVIINAGGAACIEGLVNQCARVQ